VLLGIIPLSLFQVNIAGSLRKIPFLVRFGNLRVIAKTKLKQQYDEVL
jgi:hypothetical protein